MKVQELIDELLAIPDKDSLIVIKSGKEAVEPAGVGHTKRYVSKYGVLHGRGVVPKDADECTQAYVILVE